MADQWDLAVLWEDQWVALEVWDLEEWRLVVGQWALEAWVWDQVISYLYL